MLYWLCGLSGSPGTEGVLLALAPKIGACPEELDALGISNAL